MAGNDCPAHERWWRELARTHRLCGDAASGNHSAIRSVASRHHTCAASTPHRPMIDAQPSHWYYRKRIDHSVQFKTKDWAHKRYKEELLKRVTVNNGYPELKHFGAPLLYLADRSATQYKQLTLEESPCYTVDLQMCEGTEGDRLEKLHNYACQKPRPIAGRIWYLGSNESHNRLCLQLSLSLECDRAGRPTLQPDKSFR